MRGVLGRGPGRAGGVGVGGGGVWDLGCEIHHQGKLKGLYYGRGGRGGLV